MDVVKILGQVYEANVFVVKENGQAIIIDSSARLDDVKNAVGNDHVMAVLITHGHFDHVLNCNEYAKVFKCPIYMSENGVETAKSPETNYSKDDENNSHFFIDNFSSFTFLRGDGQLKIGGFMVDYFATPGHSRCGVCYKIGDDLFAGDTLFSNGVGRIDLYGSDKKQMIDSLSKLGKIEFKNLHSGHGPDSDYLRQKRNIEVFRRFLSR